MTRYLVHGTRRMKLSAASKLIHLATLDTEILTTITVIAARRLDPSISVPCSVYIRIQPEIRVFRDGANGLELSVCRVLVFKEPSQYQTLSGLQSVSIPVHNAAAMSGSKQGNCVQLK